MHISRSVDKLKGLTHHGGALCYFGGVFCFFLFLGFVVLADHKASVSSASIHTVRLAYLASLLLVWVCVLIVVCLYLVPVDRGLEGGGISSIGDKLPHLPVCYSPLSILLCRTF